MVTQQKTPVRRFLTQRPESIGDFVVVWVSISLTPLVAWPIVGWITGSMSEGFIRVVPLLIAAPIGSVVVLSIIYRQRRRARADRQ